MYTACIYELQVSFKECGERIKQTFQSQRWGHTAQEIHFFNVSSYYPWTCKHTNMNETVILWLHFGKGSRGGIYSKLKNVRRKNVLKWSVAY